MKPRAGVPGPAPTARALVLRLKRLGTRRNREGMARYGLHSVRMFGVSVAAIRQIARAVGPRHQLARDLWATGWYEARMLAVFVDEPAKVTPAQMDRWCRDFDNWGICDAACFALFDRTPHAFRKVAAWAPRKEEFVRRAAFALLASLALHDKSAPDAAFMRGLTFIERAAGDDRNFVKKGVSWALRAIGARNRRLHRAAVALARRLATSAAPSARWIGTDALRDLTRPLVARRLERRG